MASNKIRCLMIGQAGIGKSTFLQNFPDSNFISPEESESLNVHRKKYKFTCLNSKQSSVKSKKLKNSDVEMNVEFDQVEVEIDSYDINNETYLNTSDMGENIESVSNKLINTKPFKVIILAFAMDDSNSFELVRSKWEIDLKKNSSQQYEFILLGLKSDTVEKNSENNDKKDKSSELLSSKKSVNIKRSSTFAHKKRSCSINSNSSTSRLQLKKRHSASETDIISNLMLSTKIFKNFAKQLGSGTFVQSTTHDPTGTKSIDTYALLTKNICSIFNNIDLMASSTKSIVTNNSNNSNTIRKKIPKSLTAPVNYLVNRTKSKPAYINTEITNTKDEQTSVNNAGFVQLDDNNHSYNMKQPSSNMTVKEKFSRLFLGLGTYIVTCGSANSRKLANVKRMNLKASKTNGNLNNKFVDKNWLLLSSHTSLNSLDDVFT